MSLTKQYLKKRTVCKVTFTVPKKLAGVASIVHLVGDFNDWNKSVTPMKQLKNGSFAATLMLLPDAEYEFRFLFDGLTWQNDPQADKQAANVYGGENSVVVV
jgi:1,4-alpha-glucan branching enzyme